MDSKPVPSREWLTVTAKAMIWLAVGGLSLGFAFSVLMSTADIVDYFTRNAIDTGARMSLLYSMLASAGLPILTSAGYMATRIDRTRSAECLYHASRRLSPLYLVGFLPLVFRWEVWKNKDIAFLAIAGLLSLATWLTYRQLKYTVPFQWETKVHELLKRSVGAFSSHAPRSTKRLSLYVVLCSTCAYVVYFSYYTLAFHYSVRSGYDLALENNLMWNLVHGGPFFKSSPLVGPEGTHFGFHATLFAFVMAPLYAFYPRAETLLVIQAALLGGAAIPLYFFSRRHLGSNTACIISVAYLFYPALHGANIFEFHYLPLGMFFLFSALVLLEAKRDLWAAIFVAITLSVREDVSAWVAILGAYLLLSGRRPVAGLALSIVGLAYFGIMKFAIMPQFMQGGSESFTNIFVKLVPPDGGGFGEILTTVLANPAYTLSTLLVPSKLVYVLQLFVPLAFIPFRYRLFPLFALPGFFFTLLSTNYSAAVSIHYQYSAHWIAFIFPATVLALEQMRERKSRGAPLAALLFSTLVMSYQYGSILQRNTSFGGPIHYTFGVDEDGKRRRAALDEILADLPKDAKVSCSGFVTPQLSSRPDAYSMTLGIYDAEYIVFPTKRSHFIVNERDTVSRLLQTKQFGIVSISPPFVLAKRGASTDRNRAFLRTLRKKRKRHRK